MKRLVIVSFAAAAIMLASACGNKRQTEQSTVANGRADMEVYGITDCTWEQTEWCSQINVFLPTINPRSDSQRKNPDFCACYDNDPELAVETCRRILDSIHNRDLIACAAHCYPQIIIDWDSTKLPHHVRRPLPLAIHQPF